MEHENKLAFLLEKLPNLSLLSPATPAEALRLIDTMIPVVIANASRCPTTKESGSKEKCFVIGFSQSGAALFKELPAAPTKKESIIFVGYAMSLLTKKKPYPVYLDLFEYADIDFPEWHDLKALPVDLVKLNMLGEIRKILWTVRSIVTDHAPLEQSLENARVRQGLHSETIAALGQFLKDPIVQRAWRTRLVNILNNNKNSLGIW